MIITIKYADESKSGKSVRIKDQDDNVYYTKDMSLIHMQGQAVDIETSVSPAKGNYPEMRWINKWYEVQGHPGPAPSRANNGGNIAQHVPDEIRHTSGLAVPQPGISEKEASIAAQGIMKAGNFRCDTALQAYCIYAEIRELVLNPPPIVKDNPQTEPDFPDDIPY